MWKILVASLLFLFSLQAELLEVSLPTRSNVKRLYITEVEEPYLRQLRDLLQQDLDRGGAATVAEERSHCSYLLSLHSANEKLILTLLSPGTGETRKYPPIALTKDLAQDRREIHRLADRLHEELFGVQGIASSRLLYTQRSKNSSPNGLAWISEVWIADSDGANARQLTHTEGYCLSPGFLPNQKEFFYVFHNEGQSKIYKAPLSRPNEAKLLFSMRGNQLLPAVAKSGKQIAFIADLAGRPDLFVQFLNAKGDAIGKPRQIYSSPKATQASPVFSPDGEKIAFVSDKDGTPRIYLIDLTAPPSKPKLLTKRFRDNSSPSWSPDGRKIAYAAKVDGVRQICLLDLETEAEIPVTTGLEPKENPAWAPNNLHLLFNTESEMGSELYLMVPNATPPVQITKGAGQKRFGSWEIK